MTIEIILAIAIFAFVGAGTPGPNNIMLMSSGVNYGFAKSIPHILGIVGGMILLNICSAIGLGQLFQLYPSALTYLKIAACIYMLWLSWRIAFSKAIAKDATPHKTRPLTFIEAAIFQWVNPKAVFMALTAVTLYMVPGELIVSGAAIVLVFIFVQLICQSSWTAFGVALRKFLSEPKRLRIFNICMGVLLILAILPIVFI